MLAKKIAFLGLAGTILAAASANAGTLAPEQAEIARKVGPVLNNVPIEKILPSGHADLYELVTPQGIFYTDKSGSFVLFGGTIVDTKTKVNLTEQRMDELINFKFVDFPLKDAVKTVRGTGARVMVSFEDPNCGYCKKLMQEVNKIDNLTVYTFLVPILSPDSASKAKAIWCANNPSKTWNDFMGAGATLPEVAKPGCEVPFDRNLALMRKLHIAGTPALYFSDNSKAKGYIKADQIEAKLR
jgi:thiol:disulfide interchange protein DsbC